MTPPSRYSASPLPSFCTVSRASASRVRFRRELIVLFEGGSPKPEHARRPPRYPQQQREAWRPQRAIPPKRSKAEALRKLLEQMSRQNEEIRAFMTKARRGTAQ